jgi:hypothetical protein
MDTYVCDECFHQFVSLWHIRHNHKEIIVRSSQQIRTEDDSKRVRCHLVVFFVVCNPKLGLAAESTSEKSIHLSRCSTTRFRASKLYRGSA